MSHTMRITETLSALDAELAEFEADVTVNWHRASGDGFNEPREPAFGELAGVVQVSGPYIRPLKLALWADLWVEANQQAIEADVGYASLKF